MTDAPEADTHVYLCQCLCPARHAIVAMAGAYLSQANAEAVLIPLATKAVDRAITLGLQNPRCALCGAKRDAWTFEVGRTRWRTMEEAQAPLEEAQREQMAINAIFGDIPRSD